MGKIATIKKRWTQWLESIKRPVKKILNAIYLPGFEGASALEVWVIFMTYVGKPRFGLYAGALTFNFFIALFPSFIFLFTLVAYIPIEGLQASILNLMELLMPDGAYQTMHSTVKDIILIQRGGLLSVGFLSALYFASNGFFNMMVAFDSSLESEIRRERSYMKKRFMSIFLTILISLLLISSILVMVSSGYLHKEIIQLGANTVMMDIIRKMTELLVVSTLVFFIISFIYYYGPSHVNKWRIITPGSIVAATLSLLSTYLFTTYVNYFNTYNKIYGSIGAIIAIMLLIYVNIYAILIGFELNHSINKVSLEKRRLESLEPNSDIGIGGLGD
jgi:membrane protein